MTKSNNKTSNLFKADNYKSIPTTLYTSTHMQYVNKEGVIIETTVSSDFKLMYGLLFDQCRSFANQVGADGEGQDLYQEWDALFRTIGRKYTGDKNSLQIVKLLEDSGILIQTKRANSTNTIKYVFDVTDIPTIKFYNPEYDAWKGQQKQRRADRAAAYEEQKHAKLKAIQEAKEQHKLKDCVVSEISKVEPAKTIEPVKSEPVRESEPTEKVKPVESVPTQTHWQKYKDTLVVKHKAKWEVLSDGQKMSVRTAVNSAISDNFVLVEDNFLREIARVTYVHDKPSQSAQAVKNIQTNNIKPDNSYRPEHLRNNVTNAYDYDNYDDDDGDENIPF